MKFQAFMTKPKFSRVNDKYHSYNYCVLNGFECICINFGMIKSVNSREKILLIHYSIVDYLILSSLKSFYCYLTSLNISVFMCLCTPECRRIWCRRNVVCQRTCLFFQSGSVTINNDTSINVMFSTKNKSSNDTLTLTIDIQFARIFTFIIENERHLS